MLALIYAILRLLLSGLQSRSQLMLEDMALRHQLTVLRRSLSQPRLRNTDRLFWVLLQQC
jgi:putative transposase